MRSIPLGHLSCIIVKFRVFLLFFVAAYLSFGICYFLGELKKKFPHFDDSTLTICLKVAQNDVEMATSA